MFTATPEPNNAPPRVLLELDSGGSNYTELVICRDGQNIRQRPALGSSQIVVYDYEAPYGRNITYTAVGRLDDDTPVSESVSTVIDSDIGWLIHPRQPSLSFPLPDLSSENGGVQLLGQTENAAQATEFSPLGSDKPIVVISGSRIADSRTMTLVTVSRAEKEAMDMLLRDEVPLVIRFPALWDMDFTEGFYKVRTVKKTPYLDQKGEWLLQWELPIQQVRPIVATLQAQHTWQDVLDGNDSWQDVLDKYANWYGLMVNEQVA